MALYPKLIQDALAQVIYPGTKKNIIESGLLAGDIRIEGQKVSFTLSFEKQTDPFMKSVVKAAEANIKYACQQVDEEVEVEIKTEAKQAPRPEPEKLLPQVKNVIAIASGKGGVGKSTVSANLAVGLSMLGYKVGLIDADVFGPSMPKMFNLEDFKPYAERIDGRDLLIPAEQYGVKLLSVGFFVDKDSATIWRGSMASSAIKQFIGDTNWGELDYLLIDMPPGTSDIHLTVVQTLGLTGAVVVSTPQQVALADARKGIDMFVNEKINVPVLGLVENMAWFTPAELPNNRYYLFGKEGVKQLAEEMNVPLLAQIPVVQSVCECGDQGTPIVMNYDSMVGQSFLSLAQSVVTQINIRNANLPKTERVQTSK
ncbi:MAG: Mrp/NBP35 family ATP-binding protein [Bacteroidales bacterium]|nr:Mrp/NBP35 family ATP-binding protein [Bacteroidales bacterium]